MSIDTEILTALRAAPSVFLSGAELAQRLKVTRAAVKAGIEELRRLGYEIAANPQGSYRLVSAPDVLHPDDLRAQLGKTRVIGRDLQVFRKTTSTNDIVEKLARDGVPEGVVVFAESQTKGRGRLGRRWASPEGQGLWFSILLRPVLRPQEATQLTIVAATALARAIREQTGLAPEVKWPNDLLLRGRKVAGILTELTAETDRIRYIVLGIGLDVNQAAGDFGPDLRRLATSLRLEGGHPFNRAELAVAILRALDHDYARLKSGQFETIADEWERLCSTLGQDVTIHIGSRRVRGRAESLDAEGALLVRTEHGHLERVTGGDVTLGK